MQRVVLGFDLQEAAGKAKCALPAFACGLNQSPSKSLAYDARCSWTSESTTSQGQQTSTRVRMCKSNAIFSAGSHRPRSLVLAWHGHSCITVLVAAAFGLGGLGCAACVFAIM